MNDNNETLRDERTEAVANVSLGWAYTVLLLGVYASALVRSLVLKEACWDMLALAILSSAIAAFYQLRQKVISWRMMTKPAILFAVLGAVFACVLAFLKA